MLRLERFLEWVSERLNVLAACAMVFVMLLTVADVILRRFMMPVAGAYDIVSLVSSFIISFSLGYTSIQKGHIAVEFLFERLPERAAHVLMAINELTASVFFILLAWQSFAFAIRSQASNEVSPTIQLPLYPFIAGLALGATLLAIILMLSFTKEFRKALWR
jgi:TRAP-type C4-dicarboxylate transport system permease small subunit